MYMSASVSNITEFRRFLNETGSMYDEINNILSSTITSIKTQPTAVPYERDQYNSLFDNLNVREEVCENLISQLNDTKDDINNVIAKVNTVMQTIHKAKKTINHQNFRPGLQGLLKQKINTEAPYIRRTLPGPIGDFLRSKTWEDVPYTRKRTFSNKTGGRKNRTTRKTR